MTPQNSAVFFPGAGIINLKYRFNSSTLPKRQIRHDRQSALAHFQFRAWRPCAVMQNRKPDRAKARRAHGARNTADFLARESKDPTGGWQALTMKLKAEHSFLQAAARSRPLYRFLPKVASLVERDCAIQARLERDGLVVGIDPDPRDAVFEANSLDH